MRHQAETAAAPLRLSLTSLSLSLSPPVLCAAEERYEEAQVEGADAAQKGWLDRALTGGSSTLALAFLCNKALFPVRTPITLALTPAVAR